MVRGALLPVTCSVVVAVYFGTRTGSLDPAIVREAFGAIASVAGTIAGFLFTAIAVLTSLKDSPLLARMMETGHYRVMVRDTFLACATLLASLVLSVGLIFINRCSDRIAVSAVILFFLLGILLSAETGRRFWLIAKYL